MGDDKISPSGFLTVAYFYHLGCALSLASFYSSLLELAPVLLHAFPLGDLFASFPALVSARVP